VLHPPSKKSYGSANVTFNEHDTYFSSPYLQGENSTMEDKDGGDFQDFFFLDLPSSKPVPVSNSML
jgi:hypothetical protein